MHTVAVFVQYEHDASEERDLKSKPKIEQDLESRFTRARHGTLKDNYDSKNICETVIDRVQRLGTMPTVFTLWTRLSIRRSMCG